MEQVDWSPLFAPGLVLSAAAGLALLAVAAAWRGRLTVPRWINRSALALRLLVLACAVLLVLRPEVVRQESREQPRRLVVLADDTQSLRLRDTGLGPARAEQGRDALEAFLAGCAARGWQVQAFDAGLRLTPRQPQDHAFRASAPASPLGECLAAAAEHATHAQAGAPAATPPAAVILFTDGCVNRGRPLRSAAALLRARAIPLFAVALGEAQPQPPDASLSDLIVRRAEEALLPEPLRAGQRLLVEARGQLLPGGPELTGPLADALARLAVAGPLGKSGAEFVEADALRHRLRTAPAWTPVRLAFTPRAPGFYRLRLGLEPLAGERLLANNVAYGSVEVLPPRKRVLYICSRLGQDYRHLKALFASWDGPPVEVVPDFLRTQAPAEPGGSTPAEEALARWLEEGTPAAWPKGGAVIWEEPDFARLPARTQAKLRAALQSGEVGVIWIVAEPAEALRRRLSGSPLEDAFLFRDLVPSAATDAVGAVSATVAAREHPATRWAFASGAAQDAFRDFSPVAAWGEFAAPREKTAVLLQAGTRPLLSAGAVGDGRVALLATGEAWRWLNPLKSTPGCEAAPRLAGEFLRRLVEWAAAATARDEPPVRVYLAKDSWDLGEPLTARVAVRLANVRDEARVQYDLAALKAGTRSPAPMWAAFGSDVGAPVAAWSGDAPLGGAPGLARVFAGTAGAPGETGEWLLRVRALSPAGEELGQDRVQFVVQGSALEELSVRPDREELEAAVAAAGSSGTDPTSGQSLNSQVFAPEPARMQALLDMLAPRMKPEVTTRVTRLPVVSTGSLLFLLVLALAVDIWLRRG
jgi:hypothetical protein